MAFQVLSFPPLMGKNQFVLIITVLALTVASGCSSAEKKAAELMENGNYTDAEIAYENILRDEPDNAEAKAALPKVRVKVIESRLISIRKERMGGATTADALVDTLKEENRWQTQPTGPAAFTQREELDFATDVLLKEFRNPRFSKFPLRREYQLRQYESLFQVSHLSEYKKLQAQTQSDGRTMCAEYSRQLKPNLIYVSIFTKKFCNFWKANSIFKIENKFLNKQLYSEVMATSNITGFPPQAQHDILTRLNTNLKATPWYSASGDQKLNLSLTGNWSSDLQRNTTQLIHHYQVQESYVDTESVMKTRQVPYTQTNYVYDSLTQTSNPVTTTQYRNETYWEQEPVTRTRSVDKTYPYGGWQLHQALKLTLDGSGSIMGHPLQLAVNDESVTEDTESDASDAGIGLYPKKPTLIPNPNQWLESHEQLLSEQLQEKASSAWADLFCSEGTIDTYAISGDRVHRCLRLESASAHPQKFVEEWHQKFLGLSTAETSDLLKNAN
jgi:hypothetical protein